MASQRQELLAFMQRAKGPIGPPHEVLGVAADANQEAIGAAFRALAKKFHPDVWCRDLTKAELEQLTTAYARMADAYAVLSGRSKQRATQAPLTQDQTNAGATGTSDAPQMNSKALPYFRRADLAYRRGDIAAATMQLKLAIAADPGNSFLRQTLADMLAE